MDELTNRPVVPERELDLLRAIARGETTAQAAQQLNISERHAPPRMLTKLCRHLGVEGRSQGLVRAGQWGLVEV
jgi:DNA-binding NarL/FixJ family response regulator